MYDGYIFTPDMSRALVLMESPFGNSETHNNAVLMDFLAERANEVENEFSGVTVHYIGGRPLQSPMLHKLKRTVCYPLQLPQF